VKTALLYKARVIRVMSHCVKKFFNLSTGVEEPSTRSNSTDVIEAVENPYSSLPFISAQQGMYREKPVVLHPQNQGTL